MNKKGFTLVELLIVIGIIALLAILVLVSLNTTHQRSRDTKRITDIKQVQLALEMYWNDNANYPAVTTGTSNWKSFGEELKNWLPMFPSDPVAKQSYTYIVNPENTDQYILAATLEKDSHEGLQQDVDGFVGAGWLMIDSSGKSEAVAAGGFDCADPVYCIAGDATK